MSVVKDALSREDMVKYAQRGVFPTDQVDLPFDPALDPGNTVVAGQGLNPTISALQMRQAMQHLAAGKSPSEAVAAVQSSVDPQAQGSSAPPAPPLGAPESMPQGRPQSATAGLARDEIARGTAMEKYSGTRILDNQAKQADANAYLESADTQDVGTQARIDKEQNAIDQGAEAKAREQELALERITKRGEVAAEAQMNRIKSAAAEAAGASIHNFWQDKSSGARILGILAQAFSGAANGLSGNPSAPTPLDRVIARDMELQVNNLQQKNRNLENQRGVLRDLHAQTGSLMQATTAMYQAAWKRIDMQAAVLKTKFATEKADAAYDRVHGLAEARIAESDNKTNDSLRKTSIQQQQHGMNILAEDDRTNATAAASGNEDSEKYHLAGTSGYVDAKTYTQFKESDQSYRTVMAQAEHIKQIALDYREGKLDAAQAFQDYNTARSELVSAQRKAQNTGAAMSEQEFANLTQVLPRLSRSLIPGFSDTLSADLPSQVDRIMATSSRRYFSHVGNSIRGVHIDPNDPQYGKHAVNYLRELAAQQQQGQVAQ